MKSEMKSIFQLISQDEYNKIGKVLFENSNSSCFAKVTVNDNDVYTIAWRSDLILPQILEIQPGFIAIGVDQKFSVFNFNTTEVVLKLDLLYNFSKSEVFKDSLFIATELEIIEVRIANWEVVNQIMLPSYFERFIYHDNLLKIECIDGENVTYY